MNELYLFTDGSVNTKTKTGIGAYLFVGQPIQAIEEYKTQIKLETFENTSSTKLELQILLHALGERPCFNNKLFIYTDSQNITKLLDRRKRLEENDYYSGNGKRLANHELYRQFYQLIDQLSCEVIKVKGHQPAKNKDEISKLFTLVDKAARKALRSKTTN